jgi:hypothetical protein
VTTPLDLFGGSGSTLIAAHKTARRGYLCELDPVYCDRIIRRWEEFAKDEAELAACGLKPGQNDHDERSGPLPDDPGPAGASSGSDTHSSTRSAPYGHG